MQPTSHAAMSGVEASWPETGGGAGRSEATTRPRFPPEGLGLDAKGPQAPTKAGPGQPKAVIAICARDRHLKGEDAPPSASTEGRLREAARKAAE